VTLVLNAGSTRVERCNERWKVETLAGVYEAPVVVNAAGAWGDHVANLFGATPVGLEPMRRTVITVPVPSGTDIRDWPLVIDVDEEFYFKPDAGHLLLSPANEDASAPCDAVPDEMDIAIVVDRFERATTLPIGRIHHRWAGLRTFAADRSPVVGFDDEVAGFFWLVGQGGYGIQTAPAMGALAAAMIRGQPLPGECVSHGVTESHLSPTRAALRRSDRRRAGGASS
jgi:D-arginine dehydrogenase